MSRNGAREELFSCLFWFLLLCLEGLGIENIHHVVKLRGRFVELRDW